MVEKRARGRLAALAHPEAGQDGAEGGPQIAGARAARRRGHHAGRGAADQRERGARASAASSGPRTPSAPAWASMRPAATRVAGVRPRWAAAAGVSGPRSAPTGVARRGWPVADEEVGEADRGRGSPSASPGARGRGSPTCRRGCTASARGCRSRRRRGSRRGRRPAAMRDQVAGRWRLSQSELRQLHLGRQRAAGVVEDGMGTGGVDRLGLGGGAVVEPEDGVAAVVAGGRDGDRAAGGVAEDERAGGVEGEAGDVLRAGARPRRGRRGAAAAAACQIWAEDCSAWPSAVSWNSIGASARPSRRPARSKRPARALPVPMSTAATSIRSRMPGRPDGRAAALVRRPRAESRRPTGGGGPGTAAPAQRAAPGLSHGPAPGGGACRR